MLPFQCFSTEAENVLLKRSVSTIGEARSTFKGILFRGNNTVYINLKQTNLRVHTI